MSNLSWKKVAVAALAAGIVALGVFYASHSKGSKANITSINPAFGEYIAAYTSGVVGSGSSVKILFSQDVVDSLSVGQSTQNLFELSPAVNGTARWVDRRTVEFKPKTRLISGQLYQVSLALSKVLDVPDGLETFDFTFQVIPQNFEVAILNTQAYEKSDLTRQKIEGVLYTADFADAADVEKMAQAQQENNALSITWIHQSEGKEHLFTVEDVKRAERASSVRLDINGRALNIDQTTDLSVEIPALGDFKVTSVKVEQGSGQRVVIQFSDPLQEKQNLEGLIIMDGVGTLDFEIKDNEIRVFPPVRQTGAKTITVERGIRNILDYKMQVSSTTEVTFEQLNPAVRFTGKGSVLPGSEGMILPFEAVNLKLVDVEIIKVYENNIVQFFQVNELDGNSELRRVGKRILRKTISLENSGVTDLGKWNRYTLDLSKLINTEPGAIYQIRVGFKQSYLAYVCDGGNDTPTDLTSLESEDWEGQDEETNSNWDSYEEYYYDEDYDWEQRDNPCDPSYYTGSRNIKKNVLASDLGLLSKRGSDGRTIIFVNDLKTTQPISGVIVELYDYQQRLIGTTTTDGAGKAVISSDGKPFVLIAKRGVERGYLKLQDGESLSISNFDVSGEQVNKGLKGFLYGERGVWRPGDSLYLTFLLQDKLNLIPDNHPVVFELQNPQGTITQRIVRSSGENGFYRFATATSTEAPTGSWKARVKVGGAEFIQPIKIETVKPNRLKINLDFGVEKLTTRNNNVSGDLQVNWLHGAPGRNLKASFEVLLVRAETKFQRYPEYIFDDPSRNFTSEAKTIFEGYTDDRGHAVVNTTLETIEDAPGMLNAIFRGKAFEESGNFSIDRFTIPFYPFTSFTGIRVPPGDKARGMLLTDTTHRVDIVTVDPDGNPVSRDQVDVSLYKLDWKWWWNSDAGDASYMSASFSAPIAKGTIRTINGEGTWDFKVKYPEWGRYYVKAFDRVSGHATGKVVYIDWPGWAGRARGGNQGATMLSVTADKSRYAIGEKVTLTIPGSAQGRALVSIENGSTVIQTHWVETIDGDTPFSFVVTADMSPNVFAHISLIQPHAQTTNDLPMRLYGIIPLAVEDPSTKLNPVIAMPEVLEPGKEVVIKVSEQNRRTMTYTLAVVDEGLLDLTRFKTPDAWSRFYAREALGVKTWDIYDDVMGAFGGGIERLLAIGGDMELATSKEDDTKANRFKPVVKFLGPFTLSGGVNTHKFIMPQYVGSVKTMVVAGYQGAYGSAEKATPVRKPLMVLATLPRVLGPDEKVKLPVTLFAMDKSIQKINVSVKTSGPLQLESASQMVSMTSYDKTIEFDLSVKNSIGTGRIEVTATSGSFTATDVIEVTIRNPNPPTSAAQEVVLEAGKSWSSTVSPIGIVGTNAAVLEVSSLPPLNLGQRLRYLVQYPYGCIEQTTSSVFPQLYLSQVKALTNEEAIATQKNIKAGIDRIRSFVTRDGGFAYWPGGEDSESWATTYAGHFLIEAESKGYVVPTEVLKGWRKYQRNKAQAWRKSQESQSSELIQAYRLYSLALAGSPELGAMNRLREQQPLPSTASWMLAAAYVKAGQPEAARKIIETLPTQVKPYQELAYSYGSELRDKAIILETLVLLNERTKAFEMVKDISAALSSPSTWMSTQTTAWCLKSVGSFASGEKKGDLSFAYSYNGKEVNAKTDLAIAQIQLPIIETRPGALKVTSESKGILFVRLITTGTPARGDEEEQEQNLKVLVAYTNTHGEPIDPIHLEQGAEFMATVSVINPGLRGNYKNLALTQIFPSGWEINNLRLDDAQERLTGDVPSYQDIRDDRVYTYFDLPANQRKTFKVMLTAGYTGTYYLPAVRCEAMYDHGIYSNKKGQVVEVAKRLPQ